MVLLEVGVGLWGSKPMPPEVHATLGLFWLWAVGRGAVRRDQHVQREAEIRALAQKLGIPAGDLADEFAEFKLRRKGRGNA